MVKVLNREGIQRMVGRGTGSVGSGGSSEGGGGISIAQVDAAYVSKAFFDQLFTVHGKRTYTDPETQEEVTEDVIISPNQIAEGEYSLSNVEVSVGLWTNSFLSALGLNSDGGGGGGATALSELVDVALNNPQNGQVLMYNSSTGKWYNGTVQSGGGGTVTSITAGTGLSGGTITSSGTIALSQEAQTAIAAGVTAYGWGDHAQAGYLTPSALTGYATQQWVQQQGFLKASDLNGYATQQWVGQQGFLKASDLNGYATQQWVQQQNYLTSHQSVDGTFWGQSWSNHGSVSGDMTNVGIIFQTGSYTLMNHQGIGLMIEGSAVTGSEYRATFGFHQEGALAWLNNNYVMQLKANTSTQEYLVHITNGILQIGDARLVYDSTNNALKAIKADGTSLNFYATGGVSALGMSAGVSQLDAMTFNYVTINNNLEFGAASRITHAVTNDDRTLYIGNSDNSGWVALQDVCSQSGVSYWKIMANGEAFFAEKVQSPKFYLDSTRYLYINGGTLYYYNGSTSRQIAFA